MSIDISVSLYFPVSNATSALESTAQILRRYKSKEGITIVSPSGEAVSMPAYPEKDGDAQGRTFSLDPNTEFRGLVAGVPCLAATRPRGPVNRRLADAGGELFRRGDKTYAVVPVELALARGQDYIEIAFGTFISSAVSAFQSNSFRSRVSRVFADGGGVAAVYFGMGEWFPFADPDQRIDVPDECDPGSAGIDVFVELLLERLS